MAQMSAATGVSAHTLRYYERAELILSVTRNAGNQRRYSANDVEWVKFLLRLRETGMPIAQMRQYALLRADGTATTEARLRMLETHQTDLHEQIAKLRAHEKALAAKMQIYRNDLTALDEQEGSTDERDSTATAAI